MKLIHLALMLAMTLLLGVSAALLAPIHPAHAQKITKPVAKKVSVDTTYAGNSLNELLGAGAGCTCGFEVCVMDATRACLGAASDTAALRVDCTTNHRPVCNGSTCPSACFPVSGSTAEWAIISSSGTLTSVYITCGGGC